MTRLLNLYMGVDGKNGSDSRKSLAIVRKLIFEEDFVARRHAYETKIFLAVCAGSEQELSIWLSKLSQRTDWSFFVVLLEAG
ncbi:hypothetical protein Tco_0281335 [Tanacetum coccineum]